MAIQYDKEQLARGWGELKYQLLKTAAENSAEYRRGQLIAVFMLLLTIPATALLINNVYYFFIGNTKLYTDYLISDALSIAFVLGIWQINRKGYVRTAGVVIIIFCVLSASFFYAAKDSNTALIVYAMPIVLSSFVLYPASSFFVYLLAFITYSLAINQSGNIGQYDITGLMILFVIAVITWVTAANLERFIATNIKLNENLQTSNRELQQAYETTLEGWSHALDLRDKETEGHTQRVTKLTMQIGRAMELSEEELLHIRRGALLHDIGKLGVPDEILHKQGPLTEDEMQIMRQHPQFAYDLLLPIEYLRSAMDIPYYHHEKWDGTGYPHRLKGNDIPLEARIFAVIDVYDALSHDRPYRMGWSKEKVLEYIKSESGKHFDPSVVKIFIEEVTKNED